MIETPMSFGGMVTAPHHLAAGAGRDILAAGGTAIEAAVAVAAVLSVVYPHMTGIGGDGFWLISDAPGAAPEALHATGRAGAKATLGFYEAQGMAEIPARGPAAALTVPGTIAGWAAALERSARWQAPLPLAQVLERAIHYADAGMAVTRSQAGLAASRADQLRALPGFAEVHLPEGRPPLEGQRMRQPALARTLRRLTEAGLDDFYRGALALDIAADLDAVGSPVTGDDLAAHRAEWLTPLSLRLDALGATVWNTPPPTQGLASMLILGLAARLDLGAEGSFAHLHGLVEATKQAFLVRDRHIADRDTMETPAPDFLRDDRLDALAARIDPDHALPWPHAAQAGDTTWMGVTDAAGRSVSFIQSIFWDYGSGVVLPETGILMQNRGASFRLSEGGWNALAPGRQPFTTLNPAMARFDDGRMLSYGTMGGDGQPQTQAAIFLRMAQFGMPPQAAISAPRWLLGKTWGDTTHTLKLEVRTAPETVAALEAAGHDVELRPAFDDVMGHAGAILRHPDGALAGATDPRSDGAVAAL